MDTGLLSRRSLLLTLASLPWSARAQASAPAEVGAELAEARLSGHGRLTFFGLHVYDARLWVTKGFVAARFADHPLALELEYARTLHGPQIAERSLDEMKRLGGLGEAQAERWVATMKRIFPDVSRGDRVTGVQRPGESVRFFLNASLRGEVRDAEFARRFFAIWLAPQTSEPTLRRSLLGAGSAPA